MQKKQTHVPYGVVTALLMIVTYAALYITKTAFTIPILGFIPFLMLLVGLILNGQAFSKANEANITFGEAFMSCFKATLILTVILVVWPIAAQYLFPNMQAEAMEQARHKLEERGLSEEMIDKSMSFAKNFDNPLFKILGTVIGELFFGAIFSLIAAAVAKKNPQPLQMV